MIVRVLGMKSAQSNLFMDTVKAVMKELGMNAAIEEISELNKMLKYPIKNSPALMIDNKVVCEGVMPDIDEMKQLVKKVLGN